MPQEWLWQQGWNSSLCQCLLHVCPSQSGPQVPIHSVCAGEYAWEETHPWESPPIREFTHQPCVFISYQLSTLSATAALLGASSTAKGRPTRLRLSRRPEPFVRESDIHWGFPGDSDGKESACNAGDPGSPGREWQPTPGFLPGEFHGQRSLAGYSPWGHKES